MGNDNETGREKIRRWSRIPRDSYVSIRRVCMYLLVAGTLVLVSPWLSVVYSGTEHAHILTQRAYNEGSASPLAKGCAGAGVARFYLRHSSAKGVRDEIYLRGSAVFVFSSGSHMHVRTHVHICLLCLCMHSRTRARTMAIQRRSTTF